MKSIRIDARLVLLVAIVALLLPAFLHAQAVSEIQIGTDGKLVAKNLTLMQRSSDNLFFCRATWGQTFIRITVLPNASTTVQENYGEAAGLADIKEGDVIDVTGTLSIGSNSLTVIPTLVRDSTLMSASMTLSGTVMSVNVPSASFVLSNKQYGNTTVIVSGATITKGARTIGVADIRVGDKVLPVAGVYDHASNSLAASAVSVYQDPSVFKPRNFEGTLKSTSGGTLPARVVVTVGGTDYMVYLSATSAVAHKTKGATALSRFVAGDIVRFYGSIRQTNLSEVDAELIRDLNF